MALKIYVEKKNNPLFGFIQIAIASEGLALTDDPEEMNIIVSFGYHTNDDIVSMNTMETVIEKYPGKQIIFLNWFHPLNDFNRFSSLFSPEKSSCRLMDTSRYRILQLPVSLRELIETITSLNTTASEQQYRSQGSLFRSI